MGTTGLDSTMNAPPPPPARRGAKGSAVNSTSTTRHTLRHTLLGAAEQANRLAGTLSMAMAWLGGAAFMALSVYITVDVLGRYFGGPYSGYTDDVSSYTLAVAGTGGFAYALRKNAHVRVDLLLPMLPAGAKYAVNLVNLALVAVFGGLMTWFAWLNAIESYRIEAKSISAFQAPLVVPQSMMAFGLTLLTVQALTMLAVDVLRVGALGSEAWADGADLAVADEIRGV